MVQGEVSNGGNTMRALPPSHRMWFRRAYNDRAHGIAKATIDTFIGTKIDSTSKTDIMEDIAA